MATRKQARELAATTLAGLGTYHTVFEGTRRKLDGISPAAFVLSQGLQEVRVSRALRTLTIGLYATIYVRADIGSEDAAEDQLDTLVEAAVQTLTSAGFTVGPSDASPDGAPLRNVDGIFYRVERIPLTLEEDI